MQDEEDEMNSYLESLRLIERLHRRLLDVIKVELDIRQVTDVNSVQALLIYNIGDAVLTAGELRTRGHYLGSNVSYNLKKMVKSGYILHQRSPSDKRSVHVSLTPKGQTIKKLVGELYAIQIKAIKDFTGLTAQDFSGLNGYLNSLEKFWARELGFGY